MGLGVDEELSPVLQEKVTLLGTLLSSFPQAHTALNAVLEQALGLKRIERQTERIGDERVAERDADAAEFVHKPLREKEAAPVGIKAPDIVAISADGGR